MSGFFRIRSWVSVTLLIVGASIVLAGCVSTQRLGEFELENRTLAITAAIPDDPIVFHELLAAHGVYPYDPYGRRASGYEQTEMRRAQRLEEHLRQATRQINVGAIIAREAGKRSADLIGMELVTDPATADYVLDVRVYDYGLLMVSSHERAAFFLEAELFLIANETDEVVWMDTVRELTASQYTLSRTRIARVEAEDLAVRMTEFATFAADRFTRMLQRSWRRV